MRKILLLAYLWLSCLPAFAQKGLNGHFCTNFSHEFSYCYTFLPNQQFVYMGFHCFGQTHGMGRYEIKGDSLSLEFEKYTLSNAFYIDTLKKQTPAMKIELEVFYSHGEQARTYYFPTTNYNTQPIETKISKHKKIWTFAPDTDSATLSIQLPPSCMNIPSTVTQSFSGKAHYAVKFDASCYGEIEKIEKGKQTFALKNNGDGVIVIDTTPYTKKRMPKIFR